MDKKLKFCFIGAGSVNFGGAEGPWDHASRLEKMKNIEIVGMSDPDLNKAEEVLQTRLKSEYGQVYRSCKIYSETKDMLKEIDADAVVVGSPPCFRGCMESPIEVDCLKAGLHAFIEKPLSVTMPKNFEAYADLMRKTVEDTKRITSVGYLSRYHDAILKMKEIIKEHGRDIMFFQAKYHCAYSEMKNAYWWDNSKSGGPIVEQATHFLDLARFIAGEIDLKSITTTKLKASDKAGELKSKRPMMEVGVPEECKNDRVTVSSWKFENNGVGCLIHTISLHGEKYDTCLEVIMDGLKMTLEDVYAPECELKVRLGEKVTAYKFKNVDPYWNELKVFIDAIRDPDNEELQSRIQSTYADAVKSYTFSSAIRNSGMK